MPRNNRACLLGRTSIGSVIAGTVLLAVTSAAVLAQNTQPLSTIDWLTRSVAQEPSVGVITPLAPPALQGTQGSRAVMDVPIDEPPVASAVGVDAVSMAPLGAPMPSQSLGLLPPARTGLPATLWGKTPESELTEILRDERTDILPALQSLLFTLMLAELDPPANPSATGIAPGQSLFLARIDRLMELGALEPAHAMLELAGPSTPERFRRLFDIALLLGQEDEACDLLSRRSALAPSLTARIFCLARGGDWPAAEVMFTSAQALDQIPQEVIPLIERFMDDEMVDTAEELTPPRDPSPLVFRMMEAIGQPMPTTYLPLAFAQADLRANTGWKSRLEAAERLARAGTVDPNQMLGLYTEKSAAASGGIWERARAMTALDRAVQSRDAQAVTLALEPAIAEMEQAELEVILANLYGEPLSELALSGSAADAAFRIGMLSPSYEIVAKARKPRSADEALLIGIAKGRTTGLRAQDTLGRALKAAFDTPPQVPELYAELIEGDRLGEAILRAVDDITEGARGGFDDITNGLIMLRAAGLENTARQTALQLMLLERRG
ncbi:hypothetical protein [Albirhodobacter sp. R86504]|uniref:hypothetical protein n=1 Tax=Albirhodobacter sp. R86504 TaxID=3093848 RepID=UPI00366CBAF5